MVCVVAEPRVTCLARGLPEPIASGAGGTAGDATRGNRFRPPEPEVIGSATGTHRLARRLPEPIACRCRAGEGLTNGCRWSLPRARTTVRHCLGPGAVR